MWTLLTYGMYSTTLVVFSTRVCRQRLWKPYPLLLLLPFSAIMEWTQALQFQSLGIAYAFTAIQSILYLYTLRHWHISFPYRLYAGCIIGFLMLLYLSPQALVLLQGYIAIEAMLWLGCIVLLIFKKGYQQQQTMAWWLLGFILYDQAFTLLIPLLQAAGILDYTLPYTWTALMLLHTCMILLFYYFLNKALALPKQLI